MPNCGACTDSITCTSCANSTFLKSNNQGCVANCTLNDPGLFIKFYYK